MPMPGTCRKKRLGYDNDFCTQDVKGTVSHVIDHVIHQRCSKAGG